ncbi:hypothetical protein PIB30_066235 [Stylosanthes scabra]|uniref:Uncharacterized protein n=1 Tax=Stylosanthes scabra TaxID=79078 RepID=A0ABU6TMZ6_9FABA|nr:hypothetical protein [Stylosanthes scabra]
MCDTSAYTHQPHQQGNRHVAGRDRTHIRISNDKAWSNPGQCLTGPNLDEEKNILVYGVSELGIEKAAGKLEKVMLDLKENDEGSNFGWRLAVHGGSVCDAVWCIGIAAERGL